MFSGPQGVAVGLAITAIKQATRRRRSNAGNVVTQKKGGDKSHRQCVLNKPHKGLRVCYLYLVCGDNRLIGITAPRLSPRKLYWPIYAHSKVVVVTSLDVWRTHLVAINLEYSSRIFRKLSFNCNESRVTIRVPGHEAQRNRLSCAVLSGWCRSQDKNIEYAGFSLSSQYV